MGRIILYAAFATLAYLIIFGASIFYVYLYLGADMKLLAVSAILLSFVAYLGWAVVGVKFRSRLLLNASVAALFIVPATAVLEYFYEMPEIYFTVYDVVMGIVILIFGIGILRLGKKLGDLARITGLVDIFTGVCMLTVLLTYVATMLMPPSLALEAALLLKAYKQAGRKKTAVKLPFVKRKIRI